MSTTTRGHPGGRRRSGNRRTRRLARTIGTIGIHLNTSKNAKLPPIRAFLLIYFKLPKLRTWVVGIELGRAGVQVEGYHPRPFGMRGGCTIPPWPRFPRPPDNPGRPNFSRSGLEPWPILHEPSQTPRGLSADSHTPHDSGLPTASFHLRRRLIPTLCPGIARMTKPPSVQSPFAPRPVLPARGRRVPPPG